jgi:polar amino acid transport system substrate-binding protein
VKIKSGFLSGLLVLGLTTLASAADVGENRLNMGIIGFAPYAYIDKDEKQAGYLFEIAGKIRQALKIPGDDRVLPLKRLHRDLGRGAMDCTILAAVKISQVNYELVAPIGKDIESVIVPRSGVEISTYEDLANLRIAVARGVNLNDRFHQDTSLNKIITNGYRQSSVLLKRGRADAMIGVWGSLLFNLGQLDMSEQDVGQRYTINKAPLWVMCRRSFQNKIVKKRLIKVVNELRDKGVFKKITAKYLKDFE